jgi:Zn-dependent peptidase ImmA (M78 family)
MKIFHPYGSRERLFEMVSKVNKVILIEAPLPKEKKEEIIAEFIKFANDKLDLGNDLPNIVTSYDENEASNMKSFGKYTPETNELRVVVANRNLADVLRTLAHEIIHHKQHKEGKLTSDSNTTGSEHENEANALAGVFMREFGKNNPIIFE